jgi:pyruvate-formate lyase
MFRRVSHDLRVRSYSNDVKGKKNRFRTLATSWHENLGKFTGSKEMLELSPRLAEMKHDIRGKQTALSNRERMRSDAAAVEFFDCAIEAIDAVLGLATRYAAAARECGRQDIAVIIDQVPAFPARTFHEALQSVRICHSVLWLSGHYHCGLGRLDQYLWPYLRDDLEARRLDHSAAEELLAEFFISLNKDSDLYPGIQQGDNGQSLMLGGVRRDGSDGVNPLTALVLRVARAVALIDPKINLRVSRDTETELLTLASYAPLWSPAASKCS